MLKHIVMWKLKEFAEEAPKIENAKKMKTLLESLKEKIDGIEKIEAGIDLSQDDDSFDIVLYSEFKNKQALECYQNHAEHNRVGDFIGKVREARIVVDYEC